MGDERRPQFMHWRAKISCTEDFYLEGIEMCNRDHKKPEESGKSLPGRATSFSCSCQLNQLPTTSPCPPLL